MITRNFEAPRLDIYINPDGSLYLEVLHSSGERDVGGVAACAVDRYVLEAPTTRFARHPFGRRRRAL